jgi:site-specific DNA recombinase
MNYLIARVSDVEQKKALPAQRQKLLDYAEKLGWEDKKDYSYEEFDESAYKDNRKKFKAQVIEPLLEQKGVAIVVFDKIDRFTRDSSSEERTILTKLFRQGKIELHFPSDNLFINKQSPAADLFRLDIGIALAGYYSSAIRDNVKRRFDQKLKDGEWPGKAPIGYINIDKGTDSTGDIIKFITQDPERATLIQRGFEMRAEGMPYQVIANKLNDEGLRSNTKYKNPISKGQWEEIINNPFYYGDMRYDGQIYPHQYQPIVPKWLWEKCQEVKLQRSHARTRYNSKPFLFKGLKCAICGYSITSDRKKDKYNYLKCTEFGGKHGARWINETILIEQVNEALTSIKVPPGVIPDIVAELERNFELEQDHYKLKVSKLRKEHDSIDEEIKELFRDRKKFNLKPEIFEQLVKEYENRQQDIRNQLEDHSKADKKFILTASYILDLASRAADLFNAESSKLEQKRHIINLVLSNLRLEGEKLLFNLNEPFNSFAYASNSGNWLRRPDSNRRPGD